ncbi:MAG: flagellar biosynthetic protein FliR [Lachnospiraceae bacterium]|nr:flagellar biosynthetic protein FliR [Lachnospiraceae bacterium]
MIDFSFSLYDLEFFLLIFTRISCFVFIAPFFSMSNTPARIRVGISFFTSLLVYEVITPVETLAYDTVMEYALIVIREAVAGLLIGFAANMCTYIISFAGSIADMMTGMAMATMFDPTTRQQTSITGAYYQYIFMMLLIASGMYRYLFGALADTFVLIPVGGAVFHADMLLESTLQFLGDYVIIGFRIVLPIFAVVLLMDAVLGIIARLTPQLNMFAVGIQLKIIAGLLVLFLTVGMLGNAADYVFQEMKQMIVAYVEGMR